jgi:hypothetical protein
MVMSSSNSYSLDNGSGYPRSVLFITLKFITLKAKFGLGLPKQRENR